MRRTSALRAAGRAKHGGRITAQLREIYTAPAVEAAESRFAEFVGEWRELYPAMISARESVWEEFVPFLAFPAELRKVTGTISGGKQILNTLHVHYGDRITG